jgi:hypothetical protein
MATSVLRDSQENKKMLCYGNEGMISQDLLLREIDIFFNRTPLELAVEAEVFDFISSATVQDLITDIWYERINPDISNWKVLKNNFLLNKFLNIFFFSLDFCLCIISTIDAITNAII